MQSRCQSGLAQSIGLATWPLRLQELRGSQGRGEDCFNWHVQSYIVQAYLQVARCVHRIIGKNQERDTLGVQVLHKICRPWNKRRSPQDNTIHIYQIILDIVQLSSPSSEVTTTVHAD